MDGWIKLHRKIIESSVFDNEKLLKVWIWCLLKAAHKEYEQLIGRQKVIIEAGQFPTGRIKAGTELNMKPSTAWDYLKLLESNRNIDIKSNSKFSIVTIVNWELYQSEDKKSDSKSDSNIDNKTTANQQQINTNKNVKNDNNNISIYSIFDSYSENPDLRQALRDYSIMRNKIKAPLTERAATMLVNKLDTLTSTDDLKIKIIEQAILSNWKSVFPLKMEDKKQQTPKVTPKANKFHNFVQRDDDTDLEALARKKMEAKIRELSSKKEVENA